MRIAAPASIASANMPPTQEIAFVVVGDTERAGSVKSLKYGKQYAKSRVIVHRIRKPGGGPDEYELKLSEELLERGWMFLKDAYDKEGNRAGYEEFLAFITACHEGRVPVHNMSEKQKEQIVPGFPDKLLPRLCRDLAKERAPIGGKWEPSVGWDEDEEAEDADLLNELA